MHLKYKLPMQNYFSHVFNDIITYRFIPGNPCLITQMNNIVVKNQKPGSKQCCYIKEYYPPFLQHVEGMQ